MHLNISQQMKMSQQMKLAPRMIQSMEILQLPLMALQERIEQELEENVVLENGTSNADASDTERQLEIEKAREDAVEKPADQKELLVDNDHNNEADFERLMEISKDWPDDDARLNPRTSANSISDASDREHDVLMNVAAPAQSLQDHLIEQLGFFDISASVRAFAEYLIQNLDQNGRLQSSLPEIVQVYGSQISYEQAQEALEIVHQLEPLGVGARDLKECWLLQITDETPLRDIVTTLVSAHLEDLEHNRLPLIQRKTGYTLEEIKAAVDVLGTLNPFPGREFDYRPSQAVTPDVSVQRDDDGKYVVKVEEEYVPQLRISRRYRQLLQQGADAQTREYIKKKVESAKWLIDSIEQRYTTLRRVAQAIVDHQAEFLDNGPEYIVPLKMQEVADDVGVHVTTVSRAVDGKWIATPRGIFPLKRFFGGGTTTADGEEVAWDKIRLKLREIVDNENKSHPLSDDALVTELEKHGYQLARRTVTKYRKAMKIPSSRQRRCY